MAETNRFKYNKLLIGEFKPGNIVTVCICGNNVIETVWFNPGTDEPSIIYNNKNYVRKDFVKAINWHK